MRPDQGVADVPGLTVGSREQYLHLSPVFLRALARGSSDGRCYSRPPLT
jgi:hypothetical protein